MTDFGIGSLKAILTLVSKIDKSGLQMEFQQQVLDLQEQFFKMQNDLSDMRNENEQLRDQLELQRMEYRDGLYWDGDDGPFCPNCVDSTKIRSRVSLNRSNGFFVCEVCHRTPIGTYRQ